MKIKDLNIGKQLLFGLSAMLIFVVILGIQSYIQSNRIQQQTETLYHHPFAVRSAVGELKADILSIHREVKDMIISRDPAEITHGLIRIASWESNAAKQIDLLDNQYLGPKSDIDSVQQLFLLYNTQRAETLKLINSGNFAESANRTKRTGEVGMQVEVLLALISRIDTYAKNKADSLYLSSVSVNKRLNLQLLFLVIVIILLSIFINYMLLRNIRKPLEELSDATLRFHNGDMSVRSSYTLNNEFGSLSASFNTMAEGIQISTELNEKVVNLAATMLSKYEATEFFRETITSLASNTGAQMAAIYLLSDDKKTYEHFESLGIGNNARQSFAAGSLEGEFGLSLATKKVQHIKNIPAETRFVFHTVSGQFVPHEIITIPVLSNNEAVAVISLAGLSPFSKQAVQLINNIFPTLCARVEGILAYHKIMVVSEKLEEQNRELESQKNELASQSAELTEQNSELEMQKKQLGDANQLKTNFISNMSHELRTPLNSVIALSGVLNRRLAEKIPAEEYSFIEIIERNGKNLLALINDILDISRIEAGREEVEITKFNANHMVNEVVTMIQEQTRQKKIELVHPDNSIDLFITSDMTKLRHILQNLISNAVKFTDKGKVEVKARIDNTELKISVCDTGIGISESHLPHIFDEFRQADSSTSRRYGGTGLGLAIARKYATLLGGSISVKSELGHGSEFLLTLPLNFNFKRTSGRMADTTVQKQSLKQKPQYRAAASSLKTILLVEDSEPAIIQLKDILEETGFEIIVAHDGSEALGIIAQTIPDAMILDLMMPGVDGFKVLQTLREAEQTAHIPVLILTAKHITKEELHFLTRNNIHQLIQKGDVNRNELLRAVLSMGPAHSAESIAETRKIQPIEGKPSILIVEDNADNMTTIKALLEENYNIVEATDGIEAIKMAVEHEPDLILMDIALPNMDGIAAFKAIRGNAHLQHTAVIALTASALTSDRESILAHGFDAYIAKPIDDKSLFTIIEEVLYGK